VSDRAAHAAQARRRAGRVVRARFGAVVAVATIFASDRFGAMKR
jgi:hypothetical protein